MIKKFENKHIKMWIEDGIFFGVYKPNTEIDIAVAMSVVQARINLSEGKRYPLLIDITKVKFIDFVARNYMLNDGYELVSSVALVADSHLGIAIGNYFLEVDRPSTFTGVYSNIKEAKDALLLHNK